MMISKNKRIPEGVPDIKLPTRRKVNIFCDFETFLWADGFPVWKYKDEENFSSVLAEKCEVVPWLLGIYTPAIKVNDKGDEYVDNTDYKKITSAEYPHNKFFDLLSKYWNLGYLPVVWFHNASYDLTAAIETCLRELDPDIKVFFTVKTDRTFISGSMESPKYGFKVKFADTLLYKRISLGEIGEMFGSPKGEIPYQMMDLYINNGVVYYTDWGTGELQHIELEKCENYVIQDVYLLYKYHEQLEKETELITLTINDSTNRRVKTTTQGVHARSLLDLWMHKNRNERFENSFRFEVDKEMGEIMLNSLTGGFTTLNKKCFHYICNENEEITSFDCNSMYPYVMTTGLPYGKLLTQKPKEECIEWVVIACKDVYWDYEMKILKTPPIPQNKQSYSFDLPKKIFITRDILEYIKKYSQGEFIEYEVYYQKKTKAVGDFMDYLYNLRKTIQDNRDSRKEDLDRTNDINERIALETEIENLDQQQKGVKTTMNSLYGKLAQKCYLEQLIYYNGKYNSHINMENPYRCVLTGAYIALMGRFILYTKIQEVIRSGFTFLYSDTDSIKFAYPKHEREKLTEIFGVDRRELGDWKNEGYWNEFHTPGKKKKYLLLNPNKPEETVITLSGIKNSILGAFLNGLHKDSKKTIKDLRYIFHEKNNVLFKNAKNGTVRTLASDQTVIYPIHVSSNPSLKEVTAECDVINGEHVLKIYGQKNSK